jgi:hypothetical protein
VSVRDAGSRELLSMGERWRSELAEDRIMIRSASLAIFLIAMSPGPAAYGQATGGNRSVVPSPSGAAPGQPLNSDHLATTGKTLPNPGVPQASGTTEFDRSIQKRDDKIDESICKGC